MSSLLNLPVEYQFRATKETTIKVIRRPDDLRLNFRDLKLFYSNEDEKTIDFSKTTVELVLGEPSNKNLKKSKYWGNLNIYEDEASILLAYEKSRLDHLISSIESNEKNISNLRIAILISEKELKKKQDSEYKGWLIESFSIVNILQS